MQMQNPLRPLPMSCLHSRHLPQVSLLSPQLSLLSLTSEMVQQMIYSDFSARGLIGNKSKSSLWYVDFGASNHMTFSSDHLAHAKKMTAIWKFKLLVVIGFHLLLLVKFPILYLCSEFIFLLIWPLIFFQWDNLLKKVYSHGCIMYHPF